MGWGGPLASLFEYIRAALTEDNPPSLTDQKYIDVNAYMLTVGGIPAGDNELPADPQLLAPLAVASANTALAAISSKTIGTRN